MNPMLAHNYTPGTDVSGWILSEKLDGVRAIWDTTELVSRRHHKFNPPKWFTNVLPPNKWLDGELFTKRGDFNNLSGIVRKKIPVDSEWETVQYHAFDLPKSKKPYHSRLVELDSLVAQVCSNTKWMWRNTECPLKVVKTKKLQSTQEMINETQDIIKKGGEGSIVRDPNSEYVQGRSRSMLKVKDFNDTDAVVLGYTKGTGRNSKRLGSLHVAFVDNPSIKFYVGSGFTDTQRDMYLKEFPIGTVVRVKYFELGKTGVPRMPVFMGVHVDRYTPGP